MNIRLKRAPGLYVVGFMGSGKTTVGRHLARRLGWDFFDLDEEIERAEKTTIPLIFETRGEPEFRRIESEALALHVRSIERGHPAVVALGGGTFVSEANRKLLAEHGMTIWLDCPFEAVKRRVSQFTHRPLARDPEKFAALFEERRELYRLADIHVPAGGDDPEAAVDAICRHSLLQ
jgi:shikimate kinase